MNEKVYSLVEEYMLVCMEDSAHDKEHIYRVLYNALEIARSMSEKAQEKETKDEGAQTSSVLDYDVLIAACLLHDIGRSEQYENPKLCHAMVGGEKAYRFLTEHGFEETYAEKVKQCIQTHRYRRGNPPQSIEAKILFDADKLDASGVIGIARTLMYKGIVGEPLYTVRHDGTVSDGSEDTKPSFFQEYKYKLENIYSNFYTEEGRKLAGKRQRGAAEFYEKLFSEINWSYEEGQAELLRVLEGK